VTRWVESRLQELGFATEWIEYHDKKGVLKCNVVGCRGASTLSTEAINSGVPGLSGGVAYFAHTDVVPADEWEGPGGAFDPVECDGRLYGRGSCDMKGSLAAMLAA